MKKIPLKGKNGEGLFALVDDLDYEELSKYKWYPNTSKKKIYAARKYPSFRYLHRQIMGATERKVQVDHIDNDPLNNQRSNLRLCSQSQNNHNTSLNKRNELGVRNISLIKGKYRVMINYQGKYYWGGNHPTLMEAIIVRNTLRQEVLNDFA